MQGGDMRLIIWFRQFVLVISVLMVASCGGGSDDNPTISGGDQRGDYIDATLSNSYSQLALANLATFLGVFPSYQSNITYNVDVYKLSYWTIDTTGNLVQASGLVSIPEKAAGASTALLSFQHGTVFHNDNAPTNNDYYDILTAVMASMNFIVTAPDFLGYGDSVALLHPYLHAKSTSTATIDLLRATRQWLNQNNIGFNNQLFLAGYSEGGYATLATHKFVQEQYASEFTVTASAPAAGPYDLLGTANAYLNSTNLPFAPYVGFVFKTYDDIYGYNRINDFFQSTYVVPVNDYFYGNHTGGQIDAALTNVTVNLFNTTFLDNFLAVGEIDIKTDFMENNLYDWVPTSPIRFYHGQDDVDVPYANSTTTVVAMSGNGAVNITLIDCPVIPATHSNCVAPYLDDMIGYFLSF